VRGQGQEQMLGAAVFITHFAHPIPGVPEHRIQHGGDPGSRALLLGATLEVSLEPRSNLIWIYLDLAEQGRNDTIGLIDQGEQ
jgi:hypothetical protein